MDATIELARPKYKLPWAAWSELADLPKVIGTTTAAMLRGGSYTPPKNTRLAIHIIGGTRAPVDTYIPAQRWLTKTFHKQVAVYKPHRPIKHVSEIDQYIEDLMQNPHEFNIVIGHSLGGLVCMRALELHPEKIVHAILWDTPINAKELPLTHHNVMIAAIGIDLIHQEGAMESVKRIRNNPGLAGRVTTTGSHNSIVPWQSTKLNGIDDSHIIEGNRAPAHLRFHQSQTVWEITQRVVQRVARSLDVRLPATIKIPA